MDQRTEKKRYEVGVKTSMTDEKLQHLADMDFKWSVEKERNDAAWNKRFEELENFKEEQGHCRVPQKTSKLGSWVHKQRSKRERASNSKERITMLEAIGLFN